MIHQKRLKDTVDGVAANFFGTNYTEFLQKHLFVDSFGASVKTEKGWTATQSVCLSINTISTLRVR